MGFYLSTAYIKSCAYCNKLQRTATHCNILQSKAQEGGGFYLSTPLATLAVAATPSPVVERDGKRREERVDDRDRKEKEGE